nr:hypothetical protein Iba_chr11dCG11180 [Ipomoea batatas]
MNIWRADDQMGNHHLSCKNGVQNGSMAETWLMELYHERICTFHPRGTFLSDNGGNMTLFLVSQLVAALVFSLLALCSFELA